MDGLDRVLLVRGGGREVITIYSQHHDVPFLFGRTLEDNIGGQQDPRGQGADRGEHDFKMDFKRKYSTPPVLLKGFKKKATLPLFEDRSRQEEQRSLPVALPELSALSAAGPEPPSPRRAEELCFIA